MAKKKQKDAKRTKGLKSSQDPKPSKESKTPKSLRTVQTNDGKLLKGITNREFKILLKADGLERRRTIANFQTFMMDFCADRKVSYLSNETAATGLRNVIFYDTPNEDLRNHQIILRVRASRQDLWVDEWCEVTLKCRHPDYQKASSFDPTPILAGNTRMRMRFKEEILCGTDPDHPRRIYSNNAIINTVPLDRLNSQKLNDILPIFPGLKALDLPEATGLEKVGGAENTILEAALPLGMIHFDDDVVAHCDIGVWFRSAGVPLIGELAFAYRVNAKNRKNHKAHAKADRFFSKLQIALHEKRAEGSTKTALVYGKPE
jgi:hypothetical protein